MIFCVLWYEGFDLKVEKIIFNMYNVGKKSLIWCLKCFCYIDLGLEYFLWIVNKLLKNISICLE